MSMFWELEEIQTYRTATNSNTRNRLFGKGDWLDMVTRYGPKSRERDLMSEPTIYER